MTSVEAETVNRSAVRAAARFSRVIEATAAASSSGDGPSPLPRRERSDPSRRTRARSAAGQDPGPDRLRQDERVARARPDVAPQARGLHAPRDGHPVDGDVEVRRVAAEDRDPRLLRDARASREDLAEDLERERLRRKADEVQREEGLAPHRPDVRERVRGRDPPEVEGRVHDGREEVRRREESSRRPGRRPRRGGTTAASSDESNPTRARGS